MKLQFILIFLLSGSLSFAQTSDSVAVGLGELRNDIEQVRLLNELSYQYRSSDPLKMEAYAKQALKLSLQIKDEVQQSAALINLGTSAIIRGNYKEALKHFADARGILESTSGLSPAATVEARKLLGRAYGSIGIVFSEQSNYSKALQYHLKAVRIYEQYHDEQGMAKLYNNIGIVYFAQHHDFKALQYFIKSSDIQKRRNDPSLGITLTNIGNCYLRQNQFSKAFESYKSATNLLSQYPDARAEGELLNNIGLYHQFTGNPREASLNWQKAISKFQSIGDRFGVADTYQHLASMNFEKKNYRQALAYAENSLKLASEIQITEQIAAAEKLISDCYSQLGQDKVALLHFRQYAAAKEKLNNAESVRVAVQAEMDFDFEKREALQRKEMEKKELLFEEAAKRHTLQIVFAALLSVLLCGIFFLIYSRVQLRRNLTLQKDLAEYEQKALHLQMNPHFVFNCLGSISSFIVQNGTDEAIKYLSKFSKLMRLTLEYSKESLIPIDREIESLQNYLELEQLRFNKMFNFSITKSEQIEDDMALPPLLLQPFVENAIIHGMIPKLTEGSISIDFLIKNDNLICTITDDGIGYEQSQKIREDLVSVHKSMALDITKKRLQMMEAITSKTSHVHISEIRDPEENVIGTQVVLTLPVQYNTKKTSL